MAKTPIEERTLNTEQREAVEFGEGPLLIIAGAGTGKTTVVTERIKYLIATGKAKPAEILALTFTEKASREMEERVEASLPYGIPHMWISTFHSFCDRILRAEAINIGLDPGYTLMTEAETIQFFRTHLFDFDLTYFRPLGNPTKFISGMIQHFSRLKDEDINPSQYIQWIHSKFQIPNSKQILKSKDQNKDENAQELLKYQELANAYRRYEELKVKESVVDYGDLITNALTLFRTRKDIVARYQKQFSYILIDEFQDTNIAQNELAVLLAGQKKNITVVGDDDQAIYRWRGAAVSNIIDFRKKFPDVHVVVLTKNYRSTKEILDRSYELITHNNPDRLEVVEHVDKRLESMRRVNGQKITTILVDRVENEAEAVASHIHTIKEHLKISWNDVAILVRANAHADPFVRALARHGIPYQFLGPGQLFRQAEVKDLIAYLTLLADPENSVACWRVVSMDVFGVHPRDIATLISFARRLGLSLFESIEIATAKSIVERAEVLPPALSTDGNNKLSTIVDMVHSHLTLMRKDTAGQILYYFLEETGLLKQFASYKSAKEEKVAGNIAKFFDKLKTYESDHEDASVGRVVDWIELSMNLGESPLAANIDWTENNAVNLLTVHSSKGLEFPLVYLVNLVSARFPTTEKREQIPIPDELIKEILPVGDYHEQEERRLFYVAMTRARDMLVLTGAKYYGEGKREKKYSQFMYEALGDDMKLAEAYVVEPASQLSLLEWKKRELSEDTTTKQIQPITYISHSQLATFATCPLQYKYRYITKIPVPASAALTFGDTIHKTIKMFYDVLKTNEPPTEKLLISCYERQWNARGYGHRGYEAKMKSRGKELLQGFYAKGFHRAKLPIGVEIPFKIKITPMLTLGGKIDRIDEREDGKVEIIDYKTGQSPKSRDVKRDAQLTVYALAACDRGVLGKKPEDVIVSFYFLEDQEMVSATRTQEELSEARKSIAAEALALSESDFRPTPGKHCDFCEFRLICEAWQ